MQRFAGAHRNQELPGSCRSARLVVNQRQPNGAVGQEGSAGPRAPLVCAEWVDAASAQRFVANEGQLRGPAVACLSVDENRYK